MTLALFSFAWFWWKSHQVTPKPAKANSLIPVMVLMDDDGGEPPPTGETPMRTQQDGGTP